MSQISCNLPIISKLPPHQSYGRGDLDLDAAEDDNVDNGVDDKIAAVDICDLVTETVCSVNTRVGVTSLLSGDLTDTRSYLIQTGDIHFQTTLFREDFKNKKR